MSEVSRLPPHLPPESPKSAPVQAATAVNSERLPERKREPDAPLKLEEAVGKLASYMQSMQRNLQFSVDAEAGRTVVKVIDTNTGDLIRQIPEETALDLARRLRTDGDVHLFDALG